MPIITLQRRVRELGRIRIGQTVTSKNNRKRPAKLDRFRLTSPSKELLDKVAALYGGSVVAWTPMGTSSQQWEVVTTSRRLPIVVPPQPVSQWFELWSGGGCQRRCDGEREILTEQPCLCAPDPTDRECKPTTRLNVMLRDVEAIGVWRLESHGYYAATELPEAAEFLARGGGYISGWLSLEERAVRRDGELRKWMTPTLEIDITPAQLLAGHTSPPAIDHAERAALTAGDPVVLDEESMLAAIQAVDSAQELRALWEDANRSGAQATPTVVGAFRRRGAELAADTIDAPGEDVVDGEALTADQMWEQVLAAVPDDWEPPQVEIHFEETTGVSAVQASVEDMQKYLDHWAQGGAA